MAASGKGWGETGSPVKFERVAKLLLSHGAELGAIGAVTLGDADWIRARHAEGTLANPTSNDIFDGCGGLLLIAVWHERAEMLALLLDPGAWPESTRSSTPRVDHFIVV